MNNKLTRYRIAFGMVVLGIINGLNGYAGTTTMTASNHGSVNNKTVVVVQGDTVTLTTTTENAQAFVSYSFSSSGVTGPSSDIALPGTPAIDAFSFDSTTEGQSNTIEVNTYHDAQDASGAFCTPGTADSTFTIIVPQVTTANITGVSGSVANRVPIYGGDSPIEGNAAVTITPTLPSGNTINFTMNGTGVGEAEFDNGTENISLSITGSYNIQGDSNSAAAGDLNVSACLNGNTDDDFDDDSSGLEFTVSTWPNNFTTISSADNGGGVIQSVYSWGSESGDIIDLGNINIGEIVTDNGTAWPKPPYSAAPPSNPTINTYSALSLEGEIVDDQLHPSFVTPYTATSFTSTQYFRWQDTVLMGETDFQNFVGPWTITRTTSVASGLLGSTWTYEVTKNSISASTTMP
jgi:hypothetical protein